MVLFCTCLPGIHMVGPHGVLYAVLPPAVSVIFCTCCLCLGSSDEISAFLREVRPEVLQPKQEPGPHRYSPRGTTALRMGLNPPGTRESPSKPQLIYTPLSPLLVTQSPDQGLAEETWICQPGSKVLHPLYPRIQWDAGKVVDPAPADH